MTNTIKWYYEGGYSLDVGWFRSVDVGVFWHQIRVGIHPALAISPCRELIQSALPDTICLWFLINRRAAQAACFYFSVWMLVYVIRIDEYLWNPRAQFCAR